MDVPAPAAGTVAEIVCKIGDHVSKGSKLMTLEPSDAGGGSGPSGPEQSSEAEPPSSEAEPASSERELASSERESASSERESASSEGERREPAAAPESSPASAASNGGGPIYASPSVRRFAREQGVALAGVTGSGRGGRITKEDVESVRRGSGSGGAAPAGATAGGAAIPGLNLSPWPKVDFEKFGSVERVERTRIQKISAPALARNWVMIPHVTHNDEADITDLESWRKQLNGEARDGVKMTMVTFLIAASVATLKAFPEFNASLDGDELVLRKYYNIGFAADTPQGLVVPVIKDADKKGLVDIARELSALSEKARAGKLGPGDMNGGTFTISSLGGIGGTSFTPIINAPEVAILGVTRSAMKPVWNGSEFVPRLMVPLSLSYDHRVIDGAAAARFTVHLVAVLHDLRRVLL
jgi:pyruvate dehydrogenase E2 component (dihydrolipoamide acetyltransferase)